MTWSRRAASQLRCGRRMHIAFGLLTLVFVACVGGRTAAPEVAWRKAAQVNAAAVEKGGTAVTGVLDKGAVPVPPPPFSDPDIFPCTGCHDLGEFDATRRSLADDHPNIKLDHGPDRWCLDCHNPPDRDKLRLASGKLVDFKESYLLCGQCHGPKLRDWRLGVHGKRTGYWNGKKQYRLCVNCHDPHSPRFKPLVPRPMPRHPDGDLVAADDPSNTADPLPFFDPMALPDFGVPAPTPTTGDAAEDKQDDKAADDKAADDKAADDKAADDKADDEGSAPKPSPAQDPGGDR